MFDLKIVYQNHTCYGEDTTKAATFTNTPTTSGAVLGAYKTSACCSDFESKSALMIFWFVTLTSSQTDSVSDNNVSDTLY